MFQETSHKNCAWYFILLGSHRPFGEMMTRATRAMRVVEKRSPEIVRTSPSPVRRAQIRLACLISDIRFTWGEIMIYVQALVIACLNEMLSTACCGGKKNATQRGKKCSRIRSDLGPLSPFNMYALRRLRAYTLMISRCDGSPVMKIGGKVAMKTLVRLVRPSCTDVQFCHGAGRTNKHPKRSTYELS